jgi:hypothetical protein
MLNRDKSIDFLRGTAILFMTITHVNALYYQGSNEIMHFFTTIGATICFSIFLFCSSYIIGLKIKAGKEISKRKVLVKSFKTYLVYILISLLVLITYYKQFSVKNLFEIIFIINPPEFAEFLISLSIFNLLTILLIKHLKRIIRRPLLVISSTIFLFIIGNLMYKVTTSMSFVAPIQILIENLWGYGNLHRFPIFFYFPIYILGILLAQYSSQRIKLILSTASVLLILFLNYFNLSFWYRWPPSVLFLTYGIGYISLIMYIANKYFNSYGNHLLKIIAGIGKYPLQQFVLSTVLIFLPLFFLQPSSDTFIALTINSLVILALSLYPIVFHSKMV